MPYIGNKSDTAFTSLLKQDLTGASGTSLTLTHAVANANDIGLYINNVRQEPTEAYSVNGTTVTLTGSVVGTDDIYVIYLARAVQTTVPPDGSVGTAKIADGAITDIKLSSSFQSPIKVAVLHDEKAYNVYGAQGTAGQFNDRDLNTIHFDPNNIVNLSNNQFTLQTGTYVIEWSCPSYRTNRHLTQLYNVTTSSLVEYGQMAYANSANNVHDFSTGIAHVVLTSATVFKIQSYIESTTGGSGDFGIAINGINVPNIYTRVKITKLA